jgi:hypothetical protein
VTFSSRRFVAARYAQVDLDLLLEAVAKLVRHKQHRIRYVPCFGTSGRNARWRKYFFSCKLVGYGRLAQLAERLVRNSLRRS